MSHIAALLRDDGGAALTEYALVLALLAGVAIVALSNLSGALSSTLQNLANSLTAAQTGS